MGVIATASRLAGWTPIAVDANGAEPVIRWCFTEGVEFTEPFFDQTIDRCLRDPFRLLFWRETGVEALAELARTSPGLQPAGFIFHMSRCGSTLAAQMLAGLTTTLVVSEAGPIDSIMRAGANRAGAPEEEELAEWLRGIVSALGQRRRPEQARLIVKLDAWAILRWPLIRRAFPDAPCVFVYRDPVEVVVSHLARRGYHTIPGTLPAGWLGAGELPIMAEEYVAAVLARLCERALDAARQGELTLVRYESLLEAVPETVARLFGIEVGPAERAAFSAVAGRDAKNQAIQFEADSEDKQRKATPAALAAVDACLRPVYDSLESIRP
jgi:hypothetical protein